MENLKSMLLFSFFNRSHKNVAIPINSQSFFIIFIIHSLELRCCGLAERLTFAQVIQVRMFRLCSAHVGYAFLYQPPGTWHKLLKMYFLGQRLDGCAFAHRFQLTLTHEVCYAFPLLTSSPP